MTYLAELFTVSVSGTSRRNVLGAIAFEKNDCNFPWRRQPRRVRKKRKRQAQQQKNRRLRPAPPLCKNPDEDRFSLTVSFRNGHIDEWHLDLVKIVTMEKLDSDPAYPDSRKKPDLRAIRHIAEWNVDLEKDDTVGKLGSYPACPESRKRPDLRAIRHIDRGPHRCLP